MRKKMLEFIPHYTDNPKYPMTFLPEFKAELQVLQTFISKKWSLKECKKYYQFLPTFYCESKFATRLYFLPKNTTFQKNYASRCRLVDLRWDEKHVAAFIIDIYGESERARRQQWPNRANDWIKENFSPFDQNK